LITFARACTYFGVHKLWIKIFFFNYWNYFETTRGSRKERAKKKAILHAFGSSIIGVGRHVNMGWRAFSFSAISKSKWFVCWTVPGVLSKLIRQHFFYTNKLDYTSEQLYVYINTIYIIFTFVCCNE
jgi:hypothetical protein